MDEDRRKKQRQIESQGLDPDIKMAYDISFDLRSNSLTSKELLIKYHRKIRDDLLWDIIYNIPLEWSNKQIEIISDYLKTQPVSIGLAHPFSPEISSEELYIIDGEKRLVSNASEQCESMTIPRWMSYAFLRVIWQFSLNDEILEFMYEDEPVAHSAPQLFIYGISYSGVMRGTTGTTRFKFANMNHSKRGKPGSNVTKEQLDKIMSEAIKLQKLARN